MPWEKLGGNTQEPGVAVPALDAKMMPTATSQEPLSRSDQIRSSRLFQTHSSSSSSNMHHINRIQQQKGQLNEALMDSPGTVSMTGPYNNMLTMKLLLGACTGKGELRRIAPMSPYRARASAKMRIRIIPTKSLGCCALALRVHTMTSVY